MPHAPEHKGTLSARKAAAVSTPKNSLNSTANKRVQERCLKSDRRGSCLVFYMPNFFLLKLLSPLVALRASFSAALLPFSLQVGIDVELQAASA